MKTKNPKLLQKELITRFKETGDEKLKNELINSMQGLVKHIAKRYKPLIKTYGGGGLSCDDLIQEGNLMLMNAIEKYDSKRGLAFSTYSEYKINNIMIDALRKGSQRGVTMMPRKTYPKMTSLSEGLKYQGEKLFLIKENDGENEIFQKEMRENIGKQIEKDIEKQKGIGIIALVSEGNLKLKEIGDIFNLTDARIVQIRDFYYEKLRKNKELRELYEYSR